MRALFRAAAHSCRPLLSSHSRTILRSMAASTTHLSSLDAKDVYKAVSEYYGKTLSKTEDLKESACTPGACGLPKHLLPLLEKIPKEVSEKYYGCGTVMPPAVEGLHVMDLGSGSGRDCYMLAQLVGPKGQVTGVDMTEEQLAVARKHSDSFCKSLGYPSTNLHFVKGFIECLGEAGVKPSTIDLAISNCVVNLSPNKPAVLKSVYDALKEGGEFYFSDVYCDRRLPETVRRHKVLYGECISGAMYVPDFIAAAKSVGFTAPRVVEMRALPISAEHHTITGNAKFYSILFRLFKLKELEPSCENYGHVVAYKGTIPEYPFAYTLDQGNVFETNKPALVCGNTAAMLSGSRLQRYFQVTGDRNNHFGASMCRCDPQHMTRRFGWMQAHGGKSTPVASAATGLSSACCGPKPSTTSTCSEQGSACSSKKSTTSCCGDDESSTSGGCCGGAPTGGESGVLTSFM